MDAVTADLRTYEARQAYLIGKHQQMVDWICSEVIKAENQCKPQDVSDFLEDDDFRDEICCAIARIVRNPRDLMGLHRVLSAFDHAVERQAEKEWNDWRSA